MFGLCRILVFKSPQIMMRARLVFFFSVNQTVDCFYLITATALEKLPGFDNINYMISAHLTRVD